ncbi:tetratricopeptide repeat protein [Croceitalea sp. P059]|uniref:tetratricopeptide repeat protein n=1 Tax=Croceitalea sp. P059 TaxID=3075601 RepID=UPI002886F3B4|nr:tetratricopeptide repeat protein [Croceitalea sp. P059]MDT0539795.1 tetratricopeptide repeat protein [Croceitalea sp. P059]
MTQKATLLLTAISISFLCLGQQESKLDSLNLAIKNSNDIAEKVELLRDKFNIQLYSETGSAKEIAQKVLTISIKENYLNGIAIGNYCLGNYFYISNNLDSASFYYNKTIKISQKHNLNKQLTIALSGKAIIKADTGDYFGAIQLNDSILPLYKKMNNYLGLGITLGNSARSYQTMGQYDRAMAGYIDALKVLDTIDKEPFRKADILMDIGKINYSQGNYNQSIEYYNQALEIYENTTDYLYQAYLLNHMANTYVELGALEIALKTYQQSLTISKKFNYLNHTADALANIGIIQRKLGNYEIGLKSQLQALQINKSSNTIDNVVSVLGEIGKTYTELNDLPNAFKFLNQSIHLADSIKTANYLLSGLNYRAAAFEKANKYREANIDRKRYQKLNDSIFNADKTKQIEQLRTLYETEQKEAEIALQQEEIKTLNEKAKVDKLRKGLYAGGMASAIALSGLLVFGFRQRIKKNRIEKEKISEQLEHKQKELTSQTLHLVQKSQFIAEIKENLENLKNSPEKFKVEFKRIVMLLKKQNAADKDWEVFKSYFSEVHQDFEEKLKAITDKITDKELRLASYVKMGLNNNEIANILNVLPSSIHTSKYRLKQKLNIDKDLDFDGFIKSL